jgi:hypothetical protein
VQLKTASFIGCDADAVPVPEPTPVGKNDTPTVFELAPMAVKSVVPTDLIVCVVYWSVKEPAVKSLKYFALASISNFVSNQSAWSTFSVALSVITTPELKFSIDWSSFQDFVAGGVITKFVVAVLVAKVVDAASPIPTIGF